MAQPWEKLEPPMTIEEILRELGNDEAMWNRLKRRVYNRRLWNSRLTEAHGMHRQGDAVYFTEEEHPYEAILKSSVKKLLSEGVPREELVRTLEPAGPTQYFKRAWIEMGPGAINDVLNASSPA